MKKSKYSLILAVLITLFFAGATYSQMGMMWRGSGGWGMGGKYCGMYKTGKAETVTGEVVGLDSFMPYKGMGHGARLTLKTDKETISVHLGPVWYLEQQDFKIDTKDKITVKGVAVTYDGKKVIMASEVKKGDSVLKLWSDQGYPLWSGGGWR